MKLQHIVKQGIQPNQEPQQATPLVLPSTPKPSSPCGCGCLESLKGQKKRSPRQKEKLQEIANRLGGQEQIANPTDSHLFCAEGGEG